MRQVFLEKESIVVKDVAQPVLEKNQILVSVAYSFISSGTESATLTQASQNSIISNIPQKISKVIHTLAHQGIRETRAAFVKRLTSTVKSLGYSCSGTVLAVGSHIKHIQPGDLVACAGVGYAHHADLIVVPENLVALINKPECLQQASATALGAIALQGIRRAQPQLGDIVCIQGLGLLGQITVQLAKLSGCRVIGIDLLHDRLDLALQLGADVVLNAESPTLVQDIQFYTHHHGVDITFITAASSSHILVQQAMEVTRRKGKVILVGDVGLNLQRTPFYQKEIDFLISCSYGPGRYDPSYENDGYDYPYAYVRWTENRNMQAFVELLQRKELTLDPLVSDVVPIQHAEQAYQRLVEDKKLGIILSYIGKEEPAVCTTQTQQKHNFKPATHDKIRVGIIGTGGFAQTVLMPLVNSIKNTTFTAVVDTNVSHSINTSRLFGAAYALTHDDELFSDDKADVVIIASPHVYHCDQIIKALQNNKAVFVEKPMVTTFEQLEQLQPWLASESNIPLCVDYNRSFAPFNIKIKQYISTRTTPLVVHYRMNVGYISQDHWIQSNIGAERIIGEACHIVDLFCFLTDSHPTSVSVETIRPSKNLMRSDNFCAQIAFADGSLCVLVYTALGHKDLAKERMELFYDGKTIVMEDYLTLKCFGLPERYNISTTKQDKGHKNLLEQFFSSLKTSQPIMHKERLHTVAHVTLIINQLAQQGGGEHTF